MGTDIYTQTLCPSRSHTDADARPRPLWNAYNQGAHFVLEFGKLTQFTTKVR